MKELFLRHIGDFLRRRFAAVIALIFLAAALGSGMAVAFAGENIAISHERINALIAVWRDAHTGKTGWDTPGYEGIPPIQPGEVTGEEALALAVETVCEMRGIDDIDYFREFAPRLTFDYDARIWIVSLMPLNAGTIPEWSYWVSIEAKTGELYDYRQREPMEFGALVDSVLGTYEKKTVYVAPEVSVSFEQHAQQMDGSRMIIHEDEIVMADKADIAAHREHYRVCPPRYLVETLTEASRQEMFGRWVIVDESFKLPYDARIRIQNAQYGWDELFEFFLLGDQVYQIDIDYGYEEKSPWRVMYIYELTRID